jgi:GNAT superfamily N-acetyltransferase
MIREAVLTDIAAMHRIRMAVKENRLNNPDLVREKDYEEYLSKRGKGWVIEENVHITGFAIIDLVDHNVWALFVDPQQEGKNYGRQLHAIMMDWYFEKTGQAAWLSTAPGPRAEKFYRKAGWKETGVTQSGEIKFEMTFDQWQRGNL